MLTADLVDVRRRGEQLHLVSLSSERRARACALAEELTALARAHVGAPRQALMEALRAPTGTGRDRRLSAALTKLILDRCEFQEESGVEPAVVREAVFIEATRARRAGAFQREAVLATAAAQLNAEPAALDAALFSDLPGAHLLQRALLPAPERLVAIYEQSQVQAVLLRATRVRATIEGAAPADQRRLFRALKFHQMLFELHALPGGGYHIQIDGPYALFESVTRYGLKLALVLPALLSCGQCRIEADLLWGPTRKRLLFRHESAGTGVDAEEERDGRDNEPADDPLAGLAARLRTGAPAGWEVNVAETPVNVPGLGLVVPDIVFTHAASERRVYYEQLGFWSREAVWRRIELVKAGLNAPFVFGVSKHLRVSESVLPETVPAALYVFAKVPSASGIWERVTRVVEA